MDLLRSSWIPVRAGNGVGPFRLLTLEELLCHSGNWQISLPRDDLELSGSQLLTCLVQVLFLPENVGVLQQRLNIPLSPEAFADGLAPCAEWFDLDHPTQPFMQTRGVNSKEETPIQKLLVGLPEGNNHAFFNRVGEVEWVGGSIAAIALFNQASNTPSFGGGFKGTLRGGSPITTLVNGPDLRTTIWRNVVALPVIQEFIPDYTQDHWRDTPTWVEPIKAKQHINALEIGLTRGLFWQPAHVELLPKKEQADCQVLGGNPGTVYSGFRKEKFTYTIEGVWPHLHSPRVQENKKGKLEEKFASFTTSAPAWTHLSEFVVPRPVLGDAKEGSIPAATVAQADQILLGEPLHLIVGGYRTKQASILERRHEFFNLAQGWEEDGRNRVGQLVQFGLEAKKILRGKLYYAVKGDGNKDLPGLGVSVHELAEKLFYGQTETLFHETLQEGLSRKAWKEGKASFAQRMVNICKNIAMEVTEPYSHKPEFLPIIALTRRNINIEFKKLVEKFL